MDILRRIDEDQGTCDNIVLSKTRTIEIELVRVWSIGIWRVLPVPYSQCDPLVIHE